MLGASFSVSDVFFIRGLFFLAFVVDGVSKQLSCPHRVDASSSRKRPPGIEMVAG